MKNAKELLIAVIVTMTMLFFIGKNRGEERNISEKEFAARRKTMVERQIKTRGISNAKLLKIMRTVPRHRFIPEAYSELAYQDQAVPIGFGQTISQPYVVALMTLVLRPGENDRVLEIGTGSGYQAAVLSGLVKEIYTIEILEELGKRAEKTLAELGYKNVKVKIGNGYEGWPEYAPFDCIIVTAAPEEIPGRLIEELKEGGRMIVPVGEQDKPQALKLIYKEKGRVFEQDVTSVRFVPMVK